MLHTTEILRALKNHPWTKQYTLGVFPSDMLPTTVPRPSCLVFNLDPADKPGSHWCAIYIDAAGAVDYFDSYGLEPSVPHVIKWLQLNGVKVNINHRVVQGVLSSSCGQHCLYFLINRCRGFPMHTIVSLTDSCFVNDSFVTAYINKYCNLKSVAFDENVIVNQLCNAFGV
jgi:hypothetical protein